MTASKSWVPSTADLEEDFFTGEESMRLEIGVLKRNYEDMLTTIQRQGWSLEMGLRALLLLGAAYAKHQPGEGSQEADARHELDHLLELESTAAVMRFEAYHLMKDNQVLEMREAALRNGTLMLEQTISHLRAENEALAARVRLLEKELAEMHASFPSSSSESPALSTPKRPLFHRLAQLLGRG
jgi:hypothetical protein